MSLVLGCIADDFTGATDLASQLARSGYPVVLHLGVPRKRPDPQARAPFEIIALKCRNEPVSKAVEDCRNALAWLRAAGASRFYWKYCSTFDSTSEGNIGPVAEALMAGLNTSQTVYCPAFPENGRRVFMGNLFVGEVPLHESPMKDHPLTPMRDSNLMRLLAPQVKGSTGLVPHPEVAKGATAIAARLAALQAEGVQHVVVDAVTQQDMASIAAATHHIPLLTGGSALALPLPKLYADAGLLQQSAVVAAPPQPKGGRIVLAGSCSAMTRRQVAHCSATVPSLRLDPVALSREGVEPALHWLKAQNLDAPKLIYASAAPEDVQKAQQALGAAQAGAVVEQALAALAKAAFAQGVRSFVVAGGETSGAVVQALGVDSLRLGREIAPGVPWTFASVEGQPVALALKSGNFGAETFFADAFAVLGGASTGKASMP